MKGIIQPFVNRGDIMAAALLVVVDPSYQMAVEFLKQPTDETNQDLELTGSLEAHNFAASNLLIRQAQRFQTEQLQYIARLIDLVKIPQRTLPPPKSAKKD